MNKPKLFLIACVLMLQACVYSHTLEPLTTNFHNTPVGEKSKKLGTKHLDLYLEFYWDSNSIGAIARQHGFEEFYYADVETLSIMGVWELKWVHLYGK